MCRSEASTITRFERISQIMISAACANFTILLAPNYPDTFENAQRFRAKRWKANYTTRHREIPEAEMSIYIRSSIRGSLSTCMAGHLR